MVIETMGLEKQKAQLQFYLNIYSDPSKMNGGEQEKLKIVMPFILKSVIELIERIETLVESNNKLSDEKERVEQLASNLQEKLMEQDQLNLNLSKAFTELAKITKIASRGSIRSET